MDSVRPSDQNFENMEFRTFSHVLENSTMKDISAINLTNNKKVKNKVDRFFKESFQPMLNDSTKKVLSDLKINYKQDGFKAFEKLKSFIDIKNKTPIELAEELNQYDANTLLESYSLKLILDQIFSQYPELDPETPFKDINEMLEWLDKNESIKEKSLTTKETYSQELTLNLSEIPLIPKQVNKFKWIHNLKVEGKMEHLPKGISHFLILDHLDVTSCGLKELPEELSSLPIRTLNADHNHLKKLPKLNHLKNLSIKSNDFSSLPEFEHPEKLEALKFKDNPIENRSSLKQIQKMQNLLLVDLFYKNPSEEDKVFLKEEIIPNLPRKLGS